MQTARGGNARRTRYGPWIVAAAFTVSGLIHLAYPAIFTPLVPRVLGWPTELVYASGAAELIVAIGLWRRDRWAGISAALLLVIIWPANLQAAITAQHGDDLMIKVVTWIRLPLQIPLRRCVVGHGGWSPSLMHRDESGLSSRKPPATGRDRLRTSPRLLRQEVGSRILQRL